MNVPPPATAAYKASCGSISSQYVNTASPSYYRGHHGDHIEQRSYSCSSRPRFRSAHYGTTSTRNTTLKTYEAVIMEYHTLSDDDTVNDNLKLCHDEENKESSPSSLSLLLSSPSSPSSSSAKLMKLYHGVDIGTKYGGMTKPVHDLKVLGHPTEKSTLVRITIGEGKNRQVRRMFHSIGSGVMKLHRCQVGKIHLDMLHEADVGCWRLFSDDEIHHGLGWNVIRYLI